MVFNHFDMTNLGDYHNFYLLTDVLLLANVFENFRDVCLQHYGLDPLIILPLVCLGNLLLKWWSWNWTFSLNLSNTFSIKEGIRGGVAMISHQYAWANAPVTENCKASKRNNYIMYLDFNNLYGWVMLQPLPTSIFKWLIDEEMKELDVMMVPDECHLGKYYFYFLYIYVYFIKCSFSFQYISEYPHELHDLHKDHPLASERLQIEKNILNNYQPHLLQNEGFIKPPYKLVPNLHHKTNYIIH